MRMESLADVADIIMGQAPPGDSYNTDGNGLPLIAGASDFKNGRLAPSRFTTQATKKSEPGDIVLSIRASIGDAVWSDGEYCLGRGVAALRARLSVVDPGYLWHWLASSADALRAKGRGATFLQVNRNDIGEMPVLLPALGEQRRIAAILDQADAIRTKRRQVLTHLDACTDALFRSVVATSDAPLARLAEVADFFGGASLPAGEPFEGQTEGTILMKVSDMNAPGNARYIMGAAGWTPSATPVASTVSGGSVILPKRGGAIGTNKKRIATRRTALDPNLMGVTAREGVLNPSFLFAWFRTFDLASITSGSSVPQLNKKDLAPLTVPLPPMSVQVQFAHKLAALERLTSVASEAQNQDEDLFSSLQSRAFRGEL